MDENLKSMISENINVCSSPSDLKITDIRVANINGAPKHCPLIKVYTNQGIVGYGEVRDASSATYAKMLKSRLIVDALIREKNIAVTPEEVEAEFAKIADESGSTIEEVKEHYEDARAKEYIIDEIKENKLYDELYKQVKVSKGDKVKFADLFKNNR